MTKNQQPMTKYYDSLTVSATLDSLQIIADYIKQVGNWAKLNHKKIAQLRLAVDEIATNIIDYGYSPSQEKKNLELYAKLENSQLIVWLEDTGITYNPHQQITPQDLDQPLEKREIGGLGIYLAKMNVDKLIYEQIEVKNSLTPQKNRTTFIIDLELPASTNPIK